MRAAIKDAIKDEARAIVRDELRSNLHGELARKLRDTATLANAATIKGVVEKQCAAMVRELLPPGSITKEELLPHVEAAVDRIFAGADFAKLVQEVANAKIANLAKATA